uniref:Deoxyribonuclease TATDN1 n=1 Tax=Syphacia muris TaxID=451379 RepID=A0A0N5ABL9_9BILA
MSVESSDDIKLVDIGANLTHPCFKNDFDEVITRSKEAGIIKLIITGTTEQISEKALELTKKDPDFLYCTTGVHPHDAKDCSEQAMSLIEKLCQDKQCVAVGECGLDFNRNFSPAEVQKVVFEKQVEVAEKLGKPLFIHERDAHDDMVKILSRYVVHNIY